MGLVPVLSTVSGLTLINLLKDARLSAIDDILNNYVLRIVGPYTYSFCALCWRLSCATSPLSTKTVNRNAGQRLLVGPNLILNFNHHIFNHQALWPAELYYAQWVSSKLVSAEWSYIIAAGSRQWLFKYGPQNTYVYLAPDQLRDSHNNPVTLQTGLVYTDNKQVVETETSSHKG